MATAALEHVTSGSAVDGQRPGLTLRYVVSGAATYDEALAALEGASAPWLGAMERQSWRADPVGTGSNFWLGEVEYGEPTGSATQKETGDSSFEFDTTSGGSVHMTVALEHVADYVAAGSGYPSVNHGGAINVVFDGSDWRVEGFDRAPPADGCRFSVTRYQASVNLSTLVSLTNTVNADAITMAAEEVSGTFGARDLLFLGASGSRRGVGDWQVRHSFCAAVPLVDATISGIAGITKAGHDLIWFESFNLVGGENDAVAKIPARAHVERVWPTGDLSLLGIPGA